VLGCAVVGGSVGVRGEWLWMPVMLLMCPVRGKYCVMVVRRSLLTCAAASCHAPPSGAFSALPVFSSAAAAGTISCAGARFGLSLCAGAWSVLVV
jgi:hypothetical protein